MHPFVAALLGGVMIGFASVLLLLFNGRLLGVSGILDGFIDAAKARKAHRDWRGWFLAGLLLGGAVLAIVYPSYFEFGVHRSWFAIAAAGLLVGYGTRLGNGCTSGHGICGTSRLSPRSIAATLTFIASGALTVALVRALFGDRV